MTAFIQTTEIVVILTFIDKITQDMEQEDGHFRNVMILIVIIMWGCHLSSSPGYEGNISA